MPAPTAKRLREKLHEMYDDRDHDIFTQRMIYVDRDKELETLRHEDKILGGSGTWVTVAVFVPDDPDDEPEGEAP